MTPRETPLFYTITPADEARLISAARKRRKTQGIAMKTRIRELTKTPTRFLPDDYARCAGHTIEGAIALPCIACLRRTAPRSRIGPTIAPPQFVNDECSHRIGGER